jgi:class 3 adenylate cyclase
MVNEEMKIAASTRVAWHVASHEAVRCGSMSIEPVHLFHAILNMVDGVVDPPHRTAVVAALDAEPTLTEDIRATLGVVDHEDLTRIRRAVQRSLPRAADLIVDDGRPVPRSQRCRDLFELAAVRALRDGSSLSMLHLVGAFVENPPGDVAPFLPSIGSDKPPLVWESRVRDFIDRLCLTRVIFVMTDIEGSQTITRHLGNVEAAKLFRAHDTLLRGEMNASRGREIKMVGDGFLLAFPEETEAVEFALRVQARVQEHPELTAIPMRVRMAIHAAPAQSPTIDIVSRILSQAAGNQVLADAEVYTCAALRLQNVEGRNCGELNVKGAAAPLRIFEIREKEENRAVEAN